MNLQPRRDTIIGGNVEFLRNTVGLEYKTAGLTLDASAFPAGQVVKAGTAVYIGDNGLGLPWAAEDADGNGGTPATAKGAGLTSHDVRVYEGQNPIVGVVAAGHPLESRCTGVTDTFKEATKGRLVFDI
ncbi:hypothetical protein [Bacillus phage PM1]|uniref:Uncharacterized protein n=1 Tax=Bacillus phage PM1 TaxID=547228 RepID=M4ZRN2_9CAUD|nr:hypothetical protein K203_gp61 [Bacillus phage PM1]BAM99141.1 hypothetical protein [Bacillus phage PM1]